MKKQTPVLLLTGYLGSGKTTLVNHILNNERGIKFAVIVNDIGEVNIDAELIQKGGVVDAKDDSLVALQNGCICCSLKMDLVQQLTDIMATHRFDYIVIEASGICEPAPIAATIHSIPSMGEEFTRNGIPVLDCVVTVVDALRMATEFGCGDQLQSNNIDEHDIENLVIQQIEFCNIILLNKVSEVMPEELGRIRQIVRALQPHAEIIECDYTNVDLEHLINTHRFDMRHDAISAGWIDAIERPLDEIEAEEHQHHHEHHHEHDDEHEHHDEHHEEHHHEHGEHCHCHQCSEGHSHTDEYGISTFVYYRRQPLDLVAFDNFVATQWTHNIIRAKGICYFAQKPDMSYMFEQAGVQKQLSEAGLWYATASDEELQQYFDSEPTLRRDWDDTYGDRMQKIVFIGQHLDRDQLTAALDACLVAKNF